MLAPTPLTSTDSRRRQRRSTTALITSIALGVSSLFGLGSIAHAEGSYAVAGTVSITELDSSVRDVTANDAITLEIYSIDTSTLEPTLLLDPTVGGANENGDNWAIDVAEGHYVFGFVGPPDANLTSVYRGATASWSSLDDAVANGDWISPANYAAEDLLSFDSSLTRTSDGGGGDGDGGDGGDDGGDGGGGDDGGNVTTHTISGTVQVTLSDGTIRAADAGEVAVTVWIVQYGGAYPQFLTLPSVTTTELSDNGDNWSMSGVEAGNYLLQFQYLGDDRAIADRFYEGQYGVYEEYLNNGQITVGDGSVADAFDVTLEQGATISGTVTSATGAALSGQDVAIWRQHDYGIDGQYFLEPLTTVVTATNGTYEARALPPGQYAIQIGGKNNYVAEYWDDLRFATYPQRAYDVNPIDLVAGSVLVADAQLALASTITGKVTTSAGTGLGSVGVYVFLPNDDGYDLVAETTSSIAGTYSLTGLPAGSYVVEFAPPTTGTTLYLREFFADAIYFEDATSVVVSAGATKTGINASLERAASISGVVSFPPGATDSPDPTLARVTPCKKVEEFGYSYTDCSWFVGNDSEVAPDGSYRVTGLRAGTHTVLVTYGGDENYRNEYFSNAETAETATYFTVSTGAAVTGKNVQLDPGATVVGTVRAPGGDGVAGALVSLFTTADGYIDYGSEQTAFTADDGTYSITGLNSGTYVGQAAAPATEQQTGYPNRYIGGEYSESQADALHLVAPNTLSGQDVQFENPVSVSGVVRAESTGNPLANMTVSVHRFVAATGSSTDEMANVDTDENGAYTASGLPPGNYTVVSGSDFVTDGAPFYLSEWLGGYTRKRSADRRDGTSGDVVGADLSLNVGGSMTGRIVDSDGIPVAGIPVSSKGQFAMSADDGTFALVGFASGPTELTVGDNDFFSGEPVAFASRTLAGPALTVDAEPVEIGDIELERQSVIEGLVVGQTGTALPATRVLVYRIDGSLPARQLVGFTTTDAQGRFSVGGLPTDSYVVWFLPEAKGYDAQYLGGARDAALSETVIVVSEGSTRFVEARLFSGATIQGVVKNSVTGAGLPGLHVAAEPLIDDPYSGYRTNLSTQTSATGAYVIAGVEPGSYVMTFNTRASGTGIASDLGPKYQRLTQLFFVPDARTVTRNASLVPTTVVSGRVTMAGDPVGGMTVQALRVVDGFVEEAYPEPDVTAARTDAAGNYTLRLERGTYIIKVVDDAQRYPLTYWGGATDPVAATRLTVSSGTAMTGRNIALSTGTGAIDATVVDTSLMGCVTLERVVNGSVMWSSTPGTSVWGNPCLMEVAIDDLFPIVNLTAGTYRLSVRPSTEWDDDVIWRYEARTFADIVVTAGETTMLDTDAESEGIQPLTFDDPVASDPQSWGPTPLEGQEPVLEAPDGLAVGKTVTITEGAWSSDVSEFAYRWFRDGRSISGVAGAQYTLAPGDAGARISVEVLVPDFEYPEYWVPGHTTAPSDAVALGDAPTLTVAPSISGALRVGQTVTANPGTWSFDRFTFTYEWVRTTSSGDPVVVSRASTYKLVAADVGANATTPQLTLRVTASRIGFTSATEELALDPVVPAVAMVQTTKSTVTAVTGGFRVTAGAWTPSGATYSFAWRLYAADGSYTEHAGTTGAATSSTMTSAEVIGIPGRLVAAVTASRSGYTTTTVLVPVRSGAQVTIETPPSIIGTPKVGFTLSLDASGLQTTPAVTTLTYQWLRNGVAISGATKSTFVTTTTDAGRTITVRIRAAAPGHPTSAATVAAGEATIAASSVFEPGTTVIEGTPSVGRLLTVKAESWAPQPSSFTYQWRRNNVAISGATSASYRLAAGDLGKTVSVTVIARRSGYTNVTVTPSVGPITALAPILTTEITAGPSARVGVALTAKVGTWDVAPTSYTYQWTRDSLPIIGATANTYTPIPADISTEIGVTVVARKTGYPDSDPVSSLTLTVAPGAAATATANPLLRVGGLAATGVSIGQTVTTTAGTWPAVGLDLRYQWQIDRKDGSGWVDLEGHERKSLVINDETIAELAAGQSVRVVVAASRSGYLDSPLVMSLPLVVR
jgi:hypothetical protein